MVGEELVLQYGAIGLAALVSVTSLKNAHESNTKMQDVINKNSDAMLKLSEAIATCPKKNK